MAENPLDELIAEGYTFIGTHWMKVSRIEDEVAVLILVKIARFSSSSGLRIADDEQVVSLSELAKRKITLEYELSELNQMLSVVREEERE